jgi:hypothetical protein
VSSGRTEYEDGECESVVVVVVIGGDDCNFYRMLEMRRVGRVDDAQRVNLATTGPSDLIRLTYFLVMLVVVRRSVVFARWMAFFE